MRLKIAPRGGTVPFDAAGMKHKIKIMRPGVPTQDPDTGVWSTPDPTLLIETWAAANDLYGQEYWTARAAQEAKTVNFKVFYADALASLTARDYIDWNRTLYDIQDADNVQYDNDVIKIRTVMRT